MREWKFEKSNVEPLIVPLESFGKSRLELELDSIFGCKSRSVYNDIEDTYLKNVMMLGRTDIKIETDLIQPTTYRFCNYEVEIVSLSY